MKLHSHYKFCFRIEVFDSDKLGKDKSLGKLEINPKTLDSGDSMWFPLKVSSNVLPSNYANA